MQWPWLRVQFAVIGYVLMHMWWLTINIKLMLPRCLPSTPSRCLFTLLWFLLFLHASFKLHSTIFSDKIGMEVWITAVVACTSLKCWGFMRDNYYRRFPIPVRCHLGDGCDFWCKDMQYACRVVNNWYCSPHFKHPLFGTAWRFCFSVARIEIRTGKSSAGRGHFPRLTMQVEDTITNEKRNKLLKPLDSPPKLY